MRRLVLILGMGLATFGAHAQASPDSAGIEAVINHQIEAFRHDDAAGAYGYAAPSIQQMFGSPERFMTMVRTAYPPVYHPQSYRFGALSTENGQVVQRVELIGPDGKAELAIYAMEREPDGTWRISGCSLTASEDVAT